MLAWLAQTMVAQTTWREDWRALSTEEVIAWIGSQRTGGGWTDGKVLDIFGKPDLKVSPVKLEGAETGLLYTLHSGLLLRVFKDKDTDTKRFGKTYFATFQLIDPQPDAELVILWSSNVSRPLSEAEKQEMKFRFDTKPHRIIPDPRDIPPTDVPSQILLPEIG